VAGWLREQFVARGIARDSADLDVTTNVANRAVREADLEGLVESPWVAYTFAEQNRELLGIPADAQFEVLPRVVVDGRFETPEATMDREAGIADDADEDGAAAAEAAADGAGAGRPFRELLFKIRWSQLEPNPPDLGAKQRRVQTGTTLVIDWNAKRIRSLLRPKFFEERRVARDRMLRRLVENGLVEVTEPRRHPRRSARPRPGSTRR
jgi:hypothetical protein